MPETDALDQQREVAPTPAPDGESEGRLEPALQYPGRLPMEASEHDVIEQNQTVEGDDDER